MNKILTPGIILPEPATSRNRILDLVSCFIGLVLAWTVILLLIRIGEWWLNGLTHQFPVRTTYFLLYAAGADLLFIAKLSIVVGVIFLITGLWSAKAAKILFIIFSIVLTCCYLGLQKYFNSSLVLLGSDLYGYSLSDIRQTVGASSNVGWKTLLFIVLLIAIFWTAFKWLAILLAPHRKETIFIAIIFCFLGLIAFAGVNLPESFEKAYDRDLAQNKMDYFLKASYRHFFKGDAETDIYSDAYIGAYADMGDDPRIATFNFTNERDFPFLHGDSSADVLGPFFKVGSAPPNIVIILVEGLGRAFSNRGAYLGSFTPFLDSLSMHSLYWENFLSGGGRTFAVLPSVLGSLPFGKNGFADLGGKMPDNFSLPGIVADNGYASSFFYSGDASFDNMGAFMKRQGTTNIFDKRSFPSGYQALPGNNGFSWGYGDKELYRYFMEKKQSSSGGKPSLDILLTVSTHSPFKLNQQEYWDILFEKRLQQLAFTDKEKEEHRSYQQQYATILYADDALREFFSSYRNSPQFHNTIFLITGDHRMPEIAMATKIDRYHVPLIMYSPLLSRSAKFSSISSHFDIVPSLAAFLKANYGAKVPGEVSWIGSGLDTTTIFRNVHSNALMQTKTDLIDFVMGKYHLNGEDLYKLNESMGEVKVEDENIKQNLRSAFEIYRQKNESVVRGAKLVK